MPKIVRDQDHAHRQFVAQAQQQLQDLVLYRDVERRRRFIGQQQLRPAGKRDGEHRALPHAAGELVREIVERRRRASGMPTSPAVRRRAPRAARPRNARCSARLSVICRPIVSTGSSAVIGSWNTIAISPPRTARSSGSASRRSRSRPRQHTLPLVCATRGSRRRMARSVRLLPEPDSPTMPSTSPASTSKLSLQHGLRCCRYAR